MKQTPGTSKGSADKSAPQIKRRTGKRCSAEEMSGAVRQFVADG